MLSKWKMRLRALFFRSRLERELREELRFHLERETEELIARGMSPEEARAAALRNFGGVEQAREACRDQRGLRLWEELRQDIGYGLRVQAKRPAFTSLVVFTLALGIGANTAIFSVVHAVLLRPLPYRSPEELMLVHSTGIVEEFSQSVSDANWRDWQARNHVFSEIAIFRSWVFSVRMGEERRQTRAALISANFFPLLGVTPVLGRNFTSEEGTRPGAKVVLISYRLWLTAFQRDQRLIGKSLQLNKDLYTVIGVLPPEFKFPFGVEKAEVWVPHTTILPEGMLERGAGNFQAIARLKPGVSVQAAQSEMSGIASQLEQEYPVNRGHGIKLIPPQRELTRHVRRMLWLMFGAVGVVLLIACTNVASLLLMRAVSRQKELSIRAALGAGSGRIVRQLLTESLLLSLAGGLLGTALAAVGVPLLEALSPSNLPQVNTIGLNFQVLGFTILISILTGLLFGMVPAMKASRPDLLVWLKQSGQTSTANLRQHRLRTILMVAEVSLALILLIGAGLLMNSFVRLSRVDVGFRPDNLLSPSFNLPEERYPEGTDRTAFLEQAGARIRSLPGVESVSYCSTIPFLGSVRGTITIRGRKQTQEEDSPLIEMFTATPEYFGSMGIPLLQGRQFKETDDKRSPGVVIINEAFAREFFPNETALGRSIRLSANLDKDSPKEYEVVGVIGNVRSESLEKEPEPQLYTPYRQTPWSWGQLVIRTDRNAVELWNAVRRQVADLDPELQLSEPDSISKLISLSIAPRRFNLVLLGIFAGVGLILTLVGIYGVVSSHVSENTREIGIRMALGAQREDILRLVLWKGLTAVLAGVGIGVVGALGLTRLMTGFLYGIKATDPLTILSVSFLLVLATVLACLLPARRAMKVDPMNVLRCE